MRCIRESKLAAHNQVCICGHCRSQVVVSSLSRFNAIIGDVPLCILQHGRLVVASLNVFTKVENNGINLM